MTGKLETIIGALIWSRVLHDNLMGYPNAAPMCAAGAITHVCVRRDQTMLCAAANGAPSPMHAHLYYVCALAVLAMVVIAGSRTWRLLASNKVSSLPNSGFHACTGPVGALEAHR